MAMVAAITGMVAAIAGMMAVMDAVQALDHVNVKVKQIQNVITNYKPPPQLYY